MNMKDTISKVFAQRDDRAVSPVIGVILMVAITVILAAVIGTMVLGMTDNVGQNVQAGASVQVNSNDQIVVTWTSNQNAGELSVAAENVSDGTAVTWDASTISSIGGTATSDNAVSGETYQVTVTASAQSGDAQTVIITKEVTV